MTTRKLGVKPPRRPDVSGFDATPKSKDAPVRSKKHDAATPAAEPADLKKKASDKRRSGQGERRKRKPVRADARRRVHVTLSRATADALRRRIEESGASNTQILIEAHTAVGAKVEPAPVVDGPFAPRRAPEGRLGAYFYLAPAELAHLEGEAAKVGFESRSAHFDALLTKHLLS